MIEEHFRIITTKSVPEAQQIREAFRKKRILENRISKMIKDYEFETGLAIDMIRYQRDITLPIKGPKYTALSIIITAEESISFSSADDGTDDGEQVITDAKVLAIIK